MKPFARKMMFASALAMAAGSMAVAQTNNNSFEQWYRAKYGRPSPTEMALVSAVQANAAYREETPRQVATPANTAISIGCGIGSIGCGIGVAEQLPRSQDSNVKNRRMFLDARAPDLPPRHSASEIRKMIHDAKTPDDFSRLADYFDFRSMEFEQKAKVQLNELQRLLALPFHARSYPIQVDNTRELIRRYRAQAQECSARATAYRAQSTSDAEMVASSIAAAQTSSSQFEQWYRAKYGRPSPTEMARVSAVQANTAYREETPRQVAAPATTWYEGWYRAKFGRPSPLEKMRLKDQTR